MDDLLQAVALHEVCDFARKNRRKGDAGDIERIERFTGFVDEFVELMDVFLAVGAGPMGKALRPDDPELLHILGSCSPPPCSDVRSPVAVG